ncbi:MAG TPA: fatty acyl-AMP ligase [Stellaceae bacterium]|nr:fatty acyl-AMP ligase [Stellaceae bacterium]
MPPDGAPGVASLAALLQHRAAAQPEERAYVVLSDRGEEAASITFAALAERAAGLAAEIAGRAAPGERALLVCPNGIDFLVGLFGCVLAGVIAAPLMPPRRHAARDAGDAIVADCAPRLALAPAALMAGDLVNRFAADLEWLAVDGAPARPLDGSPPRAGSGRDIALLQYTSGSTSAPKGVMVSHADLIANLAMIAQAFGNTSASTCVSWLPLYHDMGLILSALQSLYVGALGVLLAPVAFLQRPLLWLRAIGEYRAEVAAAPNFAYDLCVDRYRKEAMAGVDLSGWRLALNGAEPVRADTLRRFAATFAPHGFAEDALYPAYGMAEATVLVAAGRRGEGPRLRAVSRAGLSRHRVLPPRGEGDAQEIVGCGRALAGEEIAIVDPDGRRRLAAEAVGEIWVAGANVAAGYWRNPAASEAAFAACIAGEDGQKWLRTGDLGLLDRDGNLFVTGRIKEIVIIRGVNHYPQDIEHTIAGCHPALRRHGGAAFAAADARGEERLVVVQEVERTWRRRVDPEALVARIRAAIVAAHDIVPQAVALLRPGALPRTTSGKIQRTLARQLWLEGRLDRLF